MSLYPETPRVPVDYPRLIALSQQELGEAINYGYVKADAPPRYPHGAFQFPENGSNDLHDWRMRMYVLWFAYLYEIFFKIEKPLRAIEDLFLEFNTNILNRGKRWGLAQDYAGAGAWDPTDAELKLMHSDLRQYYDNALDLLESWSPK